MQKQSGVAPFFAGFITTLLIMGCIVASYIIIEQGEGRLYQNPSKAITVTVIEDNSISLSVLDKSVEIDKTAISDNVDKLSPFLPTSFLLFIEAVDELSNFGADMITSLL